MTLVIAPAVTGSTAKPIQGDTLLVYLIDRSGSMASCWEETIGGLNEDIRTQQKNDDGKTEAVVYFFDGGGYYQPTEKTRLVKAFEGPLSQAIEFSSDRSTNYAPSGSTPLFDSTGIMITEVAERLAATPAGANVLVSIYTDGGNTEYHGYSAQDVKQMVEAKQGQGWTFTYFGANQEAWKVGGSFGIAAANTMSYDTSNMKGVMAAASVARSAHVGRGKLAFAEGMAYTSNNFFAEAGQTEEDYK